MQTTTTAAAAPTTAAVRVPVLRGFAVTTGLRSLNPAGFHPVVRDVSSSQPAGRIVAQAPTAGTARRGSHVRVNVSEGPNPAAPATVPKVVGQDQTAAATTLHQAGFKVIVLFRKTTDPTRDGKVVEEQPAAGSSIPGALYLAIFVAARVRV